MSKKKSLGHIPLGYSMTGNATFDFIPDRNKRESVNVDEPVEALMIEQVEPEISKNKVEPVISKNKVEPEISEKKGQSEISEKKVQSAISKKKVVSYYLREDIINKLRRVANDNNRSYSSVASAAIDVYATDQGY